VHDNRDACSVDCRSSDIDDDCDGEMVEKSANELLELAARRPILPFPILNDRHDAREAALMRYMVDSSMCGLALLLVF
jgi:hypothetical protein